MPAITKIVNKPILYTALRVESDPGAWSPTGETVLVATLTEQAPSPGAGTVRTFSRVQPFAATAYINMGPLAWGRSQSVAVHWEDSIGATSASAPVTIAPVVGDSLPNVVRHRLAQILTDTPVVIDGNPQTLYVDDYGIPLIVTGAPSINKQHECLIEIGLAKITRDDRMSNVSFNTTVEVEINLHVNDKDIYSAEIRLANCNAEMQKIILASRNLGISALGGKECQMDSNDIQTVETGGLPTYVLAVRFTMDFTRIIQVED